jgi:hypothetical protein
MRQPLPIKAHSEAMLPDKRSMMVDGFQMPKPVCHI